MQVYTGIFEESKQDPGRLTNVIVGVFFRLRGLTGERDAVAWTYQALVVDNVKTRGLASHKVIAPGVFALRQLGNVVLRGIHPLLVRIVWRSSDTHDDSRVVRAWYRMKNSGI